MKDKISILHKRALITCVVMLFVCIIFKLFGVQWFNLDTNIPVLQEIDKAIISNYYSTTIYSVFIKFIDTYLMVLIMTKSDFNISFKDVIVYLSLIFVSVYVSCNFTNLKIIVDLILIYILCIYTNKEMKSKILFKRIIFVSILNMLYQLVSIYLRSIGYDIPNYSITERFLLSLDYYIMLIITYLYVKKKEVNLC